MKKILFSDIDVRKKRIAIRKLKRKGLDNKYIKIFIKENNSCDMFKKISLFPSHNSFWGSEIPLIEEKINFLQKLLNELYGIDFLEHKIYLKELITRLNQYKQNVLKKEYIANFSYI